VTMGRSIFDRNPSVTVQNQQNILPSLSKRRLITYAPLQREADRLKEEISLNSRSFGFSGSWQSYGSQRDVTGCRVSVRIAHRNDGRWGIRKNFKEGMQAFRISCKVSYFNPLL